MTDVTAQAFREAAEALHTANRLVIDCEALRHQIELLLAAAEQREQLEAILGGTQLQITATEEEARWVDHAAALNHQTTEEFIKRAINARLQRQGVNAVLFRESDDE
jgi:uncharacterized protein (DUF1778 family)